MQYPSYIKSVHKRKTNLKSIIIWIVIVVGLFFTYDILVDVGGTKTESPQISVEIPNGAGASQIADILGTKGVIKYPFVYKIISKAYPANYKFGEHILRKSMSYNQIISTISETALPANSIKVLIPEGFEVRQIVDELVSKGLIDKEIFAEQLSIAEFDYPFLKDIKRKQNRFEGYLFPATYIFQKGMTEREILQAMLNKFNSEYTEEFYSRAKELNMTVDEVITLASVVEREAATADDLKKVSSVFHNRLNDKIALESCATVQYILKERKPVLSIADTKIKSPYNTYQNKGLPIGPIASPGKAAIQAALYPEKTEYMFFVAKPNGEHIFSKTYEEHIKAMRSVGL